MLHTRPKKMLCISLSFVVPMMGVGLASGVAQAVTFYVATTGSDNNFGLSESGGLSQFPFTDEK